MLTVINPTSIEAKTFHQSNFNKSKELFSSVQLQREMSWEKCPRPGINNEYVKTVVIRSLSSSSASILVHVFILDGLDYCFVCSTFGFDLCHIWASSVAHLGIICPTNGPF